MEYRAADAAGQDPNQYLPRLEGRQRAILDLQRGAHGVQPGGEHYVWHDRDVGLSNY